MGGLIECVCTPDKKNSEINKHTQSLNAFAPQQQSQMNTMDPKLKQRSDEEFSQFLYMVKKQQDLRIQLLSCRQIEQVFWHEIIMIEYNKNITKTTISEYSLISCLNELKVLSSDSQGAQALFVKDKFYRKLMTTNQVNDNISKDFSIGQDNKKNVYDLRIVLIILYFLSSSSVEDKAKHICQLFSNQPGTSMRSKRMPQASLRTQQEVTIIIQTLVEVSLVTLPNYAGDVAISDFMGDKQDQTQIAIGDPKRYKSLCEKLESVKKRVIQQIIEKMCEEETKIIYNQHINQQKPNVLRNISAKEFIDRSKKYLSHIYDPKGIRIEAMRELDDLLEIEVNQSTASKISWGSPRLNQSSFWLESQITEEYSPKTTKSTNNKISYAQSKRESKTKRFKMITKFDLNRSFDSDQPVSQKQRSKKRNFNL